MNMQRQTVTQIETTDDPHEALERLLSEVQASGNDTTRLPVPEKASLLRALSRALGLNPLSGGVMLLKTGGRETLYVTKVGTDQIAAREKLSRETVRGPEVIEIEKRKIVICAVRASHPDGRSEVSTKTLALSDPVNDLMRAETGAKRRATLSVCGLGLLAEDEIETIPDARRVSLDDSEGGVDLRTIARARESWERDDGREVTKSVPSLAALDNVTGKTAARPASQPPPAVEVACQLDAEDIARVVERLKDARSLVTVQEIVDQFKVTADLASETQKAEVRHAVKTARATIESGLRAPPPDGIDPEPPTPPRGGRKNARAVPQTTEPASAPVEGATAPVGAPVDLATVDAPGARSDRGHDLSTRAARQEYLRTQKHTVTEVLRSYGAHSGLAHYHEDCIARLVEIPSPLDGTTLHPTAAERRLRDARHEALTKAAQTPARRVTGERVRKAG